MHGFVEHLEWEEELEGPDEQQDKGQTQWRALEHS